mmetsp:Transcript_19161/g.34669  ORF Transcript_19161/g.34669 Transcript_19161/m.34669 type:complete len:93 (-) Transcript_19161:590-868(-)
MPESSSSKSERGAWVESLIASGVNKEELVKIQENQLLMLSRLSNTKEKLIKTNRQLEDLFFKLKEAASTIGSDALTIRQGLDEVYVSLLSMQ